MCGADLKLAREMRALRLELQRHRDPTEADDSALLRLIGDQTTMPDGDRTEQTAAEFLESRVLPALARALAARGATSPRRVGKVLSQLSNRPLDGLILRQIGRDPRGAGVLWRVFDIGESD
jgi:hypothetical protein